jgi:hypothetical protein
MADEIRHQFFFPHRPEQVCEYLTRAELMKLWLMPNNFLPILGHDFQFGIMPLDHTQSLFPFIWPLHTNT